MDAAATAEPQQPTTVDLMELEVAPVPLAAAADAIDALITRLHINITDCVTAFVSDIAACTSTLADSRSVFTRTTRVAQRRRSEWLDKQSEEIDAVEKLLTSFARLAECGEPWLVWDSVCCILPPLLLCDALPRLSCMIDVCRSNVDDVLLALWSGVSGGVSSNSCEWRGSGVEYCVVGGGGVSRNVFEVCCVSECGDGVRGLTLGDVCVSVEGVGECVEVCGVTVDGSSGVITFSLRVDHAVASVHALEIRVFLFESLAGNVVVPVRRGFEGIFIRTLLLLSGSTDEARGLAISADGKLMVVSDCRYDVKAVHVYSLPDGAFLRTIGRAGDGPGQFNAPRKLCFGPNGNILVAENNNRRLQEVTVMGDHVRFVGVDVIQGLVQAVAVSATHIACAGIGSSNAKGRVFDFATGMLLYSFGVYGFGPSSSQLDSIWGLRFSPDGSHIVIVDKSSNRLSRFTIAGEFVGSLQLCGCSPFDVEFAGHSEEVVVADATDRGCPLTICSSDCTDMLRSLDVESATLTLFTKFKSPRALAFSCGRLYALYQGGVAMFE